MQKTNRITAAQLPYTSVENSKEGKKIKSVSGTSTYGNDETLLERICQNDGKALRVLEKLITDSLRRIRNRYLHCRITEEQDLVQEVCVVIFEKKAKGELLLTSSLAGFIYGICCNKYKGGLRKEYRKAQEGSDCKWTRRETPFQALDKSLQQGVVNLAEKESTIGGYPLEKACQIVQATLQDSTLNPRHRQMVSDFYFSNENQAQLAAKHGFRNAESFKVQQSKFLHGPFKKALSVNLARYAAHAESIAC